MTNTKFQAYTWIKAEFLANKAIRIGPRVLSGYFGVPELRIDGKSVKAYPGVAVAVMAFARAAGEV